MAVSLSVNRPLLRLHHKQPSSPVGVAPQLHFHRQPKLAGIRCSSSPSHFTDRTPISIKPNTSHLNHDRLVCRFHASQFGGTLFLFLLRFYSPFSITCFFHLLKMRSLWVSFLLCYVTPAMQTKEWERWIRKRGERVFFFFFFQFRSFSKLIFTWITICFLFSLNHYKFTFTFKIFNFQYVELIKKN